MYISDLQVCHSQGTFPFSVVPLHHLAIHILLKEVACCYLVQASLSPPIPSLNQVHVMLRKDRYLHVERLTNPGLLWGVPLFRSFEIFSFYTEPLLNNRRRNQLNLYYYYYPVSFFLFSLPVCVKRFPLE